MENALLQYGIAGIGLIVMGLVIRVLFTKLMDAQEGKIKHAEDLRDVINENGNVMHSFQRQLELLTQVITGKGDSE